MVDSRKTPEQREKARLREHRRYTALTPEERRARNRLNWERAGRDPYRKLKVWVAGLWREYQLTPFDWYLLLDQQDGRCAICRCLPGKERRLAVDHDHRCCPGKRSCGKCVRGLLCPRCNQGVGFFEAHRDRLDNW
jgi:hypothetical protein